MENNACHTVSGFIKRQLSLSLRHYHGHSFFLNPCWFDKVKEEVLSSTRNNAVLGFLAEQAVISAIATGSLIFEGTTRQFDNRVVWFERGNERKAFPIDEKRDDEKQDDEKQDDEKKGSKKKGGEKKGSEKKGGEKKSDEKKHKGTLLLPTAFNYPNVDTVLCLAGQIKPMIVGVQVTLQEYTSHKQAATKFTNTKVCRQWLGTDYASHEWHFLWVMPEYRIDKVDDLVVQHSTVEHKTRNWSGAEQQVAFKEHFFSFGQIHPSLRVLDSEK